MKRYVCTVAAGIVLALASAGTASAIELPVLGQTGTQETNFGDQTVGEQRSDADVTQAQGNGNVAISPAIAIFGDAETTNEQGSGNVAKSDVDQENDVDQSQDATQHQSLDGSGSGCCAGSSQTGEQTTYGGDQTVEEQRNKADVTQKQGNGNIAVSPAIAIFGDAKTTNSQGNGSHASSEVDQENDVDQSQDASQHQSLEQGDSKGCCGGQSQTGEQKISFGDQTVGEQKNDADVDQWQGNGNVAVSPAIAIFGDAETRNAQGNGNVAKSDVDQRNEVDQSQTAEQKQELGQTGGACCESKGYGKKEECCKDGQSQTGEQKISFGDQYVGKQRNDADVAQKQGNGNVAISPAIAIGGGRHDSCDSKCGKSRLPLGGDATTWNAQGNGNYASSDVDQRNDVDQSQDAYQRQSLEQSGSSKGCCEHGSSQTGEQRIYGGDQTVDEQRNDADVDQWQGNGNLAVSPAIAVFGDATTWNAQGNGNVAKSDVDQRNDVDQSQSAAQKQSLTQDGGQCCKPSHGCEQSCEPKKGYGRKPAHACSPKREPGWTHGRKCSEPAETGEQKASFGDQYVGEQSNEADVTQKQGNWNGSIAPAIGLGGKHGSCYSKCGKSQHPFGGDAETTNLQGNGNYAKSEIDQKNDVDQSQDAYQRQTLVLGRGGLW